MAVKDEVPIDASAWFGSPRVRAMQPGARLLYLELLLSMGQRADLALPTDEEKLRSLVKWEPELFQRHWEAVRAHFVRAGDTWTHPAMEKRIRAYRTRNVPTALDRVEIPEKLLKGGFPQAWAEYEAYRAQMADKDRMGPQSARQVLAMLSALDAEHAAYLARRTIARGWKSIMVDADDETSGWWASHKGKAGDGMVTDEELRSLIG